MPNTNAFGKMRVAFVISQLRSNLGHQWNVSEMAELVGISASQLRRVFAQHCDRTPRQCLVDLRMSVAAQLLVDPSVRIKEVMHRVGFDDAGHFCRSFQRRFKVAPSQYRLASFRKRLSTRQSLGTKLAFADREGKSDGS